MLGAAQARGLLGRRKGGIAEDALGVQRPEAGVHAEAAVHAIDRLLR
jgi:hypothetical protein